MVILSADIPTRTAGRGGCTRRCSHSGSSDKSRRRCLRRRGGSSRPAEDADAVRKRDDVSPSPPESERRCGARPLARFSRARRTAAARAACMRLPEIVGMLLLLPTGANGWLPAELVDPNRDLLPVDPADGDRPRMISAESIASPSSSSPQFRGGGAVHTTADSVQLPFMQALSSTNVSGDMRRASPVYTKPNAVSLSSCGLRAPR